MNVIPLFVTACVECAGDNTENVINAYRIAVKKVGNDYGRNSVYVNVGDRS